MVPLYSVQQGVVHSGYFDELPAKIGAYPNLVIPETEETPFTKRDVTGICDDPNMVQKWKDIVQPINTDNDLDGIVQGYRLFPANVACLTEPHEEVGVPADTGKSALVLFYHLNSCGQCPVSLDLATLVWLNLPLFDYLCNPHVLTEVNISSLYLYKL
jgi:hypothetical protein